MATTGPPGSGYDMMPWKLVACNLDWTDCEIVAHGTTSVRLSDLPPPNAPGRIPPGTDHMHVVAKFSGDRNAVDLRNWRALLMSALRCDHGRETGHACRQCPNGTAVDRTDIRIGTKQDGTPVHTPRHHDVRDDPAAWLRTELRPPRRTR